MACRFLRETARSLKVLSSVPRLFMPIASLHQSRPLHGLDEFFEGGQALPPFDPATKKVYGRAWSADELRLKSFEELHKLWFVLLKELNLLATQEAEAKRMGQRWFGPHRIHKCKLGMARIKSVLTERQKLHETAVSLVKSIESQRPAPTEGELLVAQQRKDKLCQLWRKRKFRQRMNYRQHRNPLFV